MTNTKNIVLAVVGGALAGALMGVLFAPAKGSKTRRRIMGHANTIEDQVDNLITEGKRSWGKVKSEAKDASYDAEAYLEHLIAESKTALQDLKKRAEEGVEEMTAEKRGYISKIVEDGKRLWHSFTEKAEDTYTEAKDKTENVYEDATSKAKSVYTDAKNKVQDVANDARYKANTFKRDAEETMVS